MTIDQTEIQKELAKLSSNFYRDRFRFCVKILLLLIGTSVILVTIFSYLYITKPKVPSKFFASNIYTGIIKPIYPLSAPIEASTLQKQTTALIAKLYNFNFANHTQFLDDLQKSKIFTDAGWNDFNLVIQKIVAVVNDKQLFVTSNAIHAPTILNPLGELNKGLRSYKVRVPVKLTYQDNNGQPIEISPNLLLLTLTITRVPDLDQPMGIAIDSFEESIEK